MDRYKVNRIIEYIRCSGDFPYDIDDVIEGLNEILSGYAIYDFLGDDEYYLLMDEVIAELAEKAEITEAVRWASSQLRCGMDSISDYRSCQVFCVSFQSAVVTDICQPGHQSG